MATSSSTENKNLIPIKEKTMQYYLYPPPIALYEDVIASEKLFMDTLGKFHAAMGTKFKIPIVGGKDLDLHRLFMEVTSRGGIKRVLEDKKWREVTNCFCFPPSATNASFILRKYYMSLIHHFEQVYYFKAKAWTPVPTDTWQSTKSTITSTSEISKSVLPLPEIQVAPMKRQRTMMEEDSLPKDSPEASIGLPVTGIIDGKFESGYLCTVRIGGEQLQGVLYQTEQTPFELPKHELGTSNATQGSTMVKRRRRRRKKCEMKKRDPAHPKPNRSGYNFFFAEQHARLKLLHTGKDRGISRMIGELWNKLTEPEKAVYQEKAVIDKERYRAEMEHYRGGLRRGQVMSNVVPMQQQYFTNMMLVESSENNSGSSRQVLDNNPNSGYCDDDKSGFEGEEKATDNEMNLGVAEDVEMETVADEKEELLIDDHKKTVNVENDQSVFFENESARLKENEPKQDGETRDDDEMMPDINEENKTKSVENAEKDLEFIADNLEKNPQVFEEMVSTEEKAAQET